MAKKQPFALIYDPEVSGHLAAIEPKYHSLIRSAIEEQLRYEPETATRNRKPLERPLDMGARWELRLGPDNRFRIFYRVEAEERRVRILAIAVKKRNRLYIAGEEVEL
jgi:mRNA-degrading endonuclease RelE of RelBE toxin-antitoxin system